MPNNIPVRILGIDPGYDRCGIAVIEKGVGKETYIASECLTTLRTDVHPERLFTIGTAISQWIEMYVPQLIAIETIFFEKNQKTAMKIAEVRGICIFESRRHNVPIEEFTPLQIKAAVAGHGGASKANIIAMVPHLISIPKKIRFDDEFDAIATALTCSAHLRTIHGIAKNNCFDTNK